MTKTDTEIRELEKRLQLAELGPDPKFFDEALAEDAVLVSQDGAFITKTQIVGAHQPGKGPKFTRVEMSDMRIIDHGTAAVVTCKGTYEGPQWSGALKFLRVWLNRNGRWQIIAGAMSK
jgi:hypothetical protein